MELVFSPSDFVTVFNQTLEYAYPQVVIEGELANFRVNRNKWVYFDLKDEAAKVQFFGNVYALPGPLEDGLTIRVVGQPRLHAQFGFSVNFVSVMPVGEGSINKAAKLLETKLTREGLFDPDRKRFLPYPPSYIGLVASKESAAYADFIKITNERWGRLKIDHIDVQVQGEQAVTDIVKALDYLNQLPKPPEVIVITRGGGSADDLAAFSSEQVTRAVAASRVPTLVAVGHETDVSLAELAADKRASTPSNAAEILVPDKREQQKGLQQSANHLDELFKRSVGLVTEQLATRKEQLNKSVFDLINKQRSQLTNNQRLLGALDPMAALRRGYAVVRQAGRAVTDGSGLKPKDELSITFYKGGADVTVDKVHPEVSFREPFKP